MSEQAAWERATDREPGQLKGLWAFLPKADGQVCHILRFEGKHIKLEIPDLSCILTRNTEQVTNCQKLCELNLLSGEMEVSLGVWVTVLWQKGCWHEAERFGSATWVPKVSQPIGSKLRAKKICGICQQLNSEETEGNMLCRVKLKSLAIRKARGLISPGQRWAERSWAASIFTHRVFSPDPVFPHLSSLEIFWSMVA